LVNKPAGWTSFDVVNYVRKIVALAEGKKSREVKVGHSGTLDPFATGLLVLLIGRAYTRRAGEFSKLNKTYEVTIRLGSTSSTGDPEGDVIPISANRPSLDELRDAVNKFCGQQQQVPPAYSAVKVNGQRAYKLARTGKKVVTKPRKITVNRLKIVNYHYPEVQLIADVSSGTYIRSLVEDIGKVLGSGAYTSELRRITIGNYSANQAISIEGLNFNELSKSLTSDA